MSVEVAAARYASLRHNGYLELPVGAIKESVLSLLPVGYSFLPYSFTMNGVTLSTFHRDVTSARSIHGTKHPVYTVICYEKAEKTISLCPGSHKTTPFLMSLPRTLTAHHSWDGRPLETTYIFDCDLVHAGALGSPNRVVRQYKVAHCEDWSKLSHLLHIHTVRAAERDEKRSHSDLDKRFARMMSWLLCFPINHLWTAELQNNSGGWGARALRRILGANFYNAD